MNGSELPVHWRFASGQAFHSLRELVRSFDFHRSAGTRTYAGVEPALLLQVIDGFFSEPDDVVFLGDRANLVELRKLLIERIQPAYQDGLEAGRRHWQQGDRVFGSLCGSSRSIKQAASPKAQRSGALPIFFFLVAAVALPFDSCWGRTKRQ